MNEVEHMLAWLHMTQATVQWSGRETVTAHCWARTAVDGPGVSSMLAFGEGSSFTQAVNRLQSDYRRIRETI